jgi:hypothetical protein
LNVSHPSDGALRRLNDEPLAAPEWIRRHVDSCARCAARLDEISTTAAAAADLLQVAPVHVDAQASLARFHQVAPLGETPAPNRLTAWWNRLQANRGARRAARPAAALGLASLLVLVVAATMGGAQELLEIFQPQQVQPVPVTTSDLKALPDLSSYGTMKVLSGGQSKTVPDAATAAREAGLDLVQPAETPAGVTGPARYEVVGQTSVSFTFSAAKAAQAAAAQGKTLPAMPANIDGATLVVTFGPGVAQVYGQQDQPPQLIIGQVRSPKVTSTGVTVKELEDYLLQQPGVSPQVAAQIRAIGDPETTLPVLIPIDKASAQAVTVQGEKGLLVGDSTGIGSGVVWLKAGFVYAVGGTRPQSEVLAIANSLT